MLEVSGEDTTHFTLTFRPGSRWSCSLQSLRIFKVVLEMIFFDATCLSFLLMYNSSSPGVAFCGGGVNVVGYSLNFKLMNLDTGWLGEVSGMVVSSPGLALCLVASSIIVMSESQANRLVESSVSS